MPRFLLIGLSVFAFIFSAKAQQTERCATDIKLQELFASDPDAIQRFWQNENQLQQIIASNSGGGRNIIITIPVVFHIIHSGQPIGTGLNLSAAQIQSQIDVLNECFRMKNADTALIPSWFLDRKADVQIEFCLALYEPNGNLAATPGITRHVYANTNNFDTNIKPATQWDPTRYLNFWTTTLTNNILGYGTIPGLFPWNEDGVVLDYRRVGKAPDNPNAGANDRGRTAVHEVGHWLGLFHTFQDSCKGMTPQTCNLQGDFICDTPPEKEATYGAPNLLQNTCNETPVDEKDMWMNYMDYVDDNQMHMFTQDQRARMQATLLGYRSGITSSLGCTNVADIFNYSGSVVDASNNAGVASAKVLFDGQTDFEVTADATGNFTVNSLIAGKYDVYAGKWGYRTKLFSVNTQYQFGVPSIQIPIVNHHYYDDFIFDYNWSKTNAASTGFFTRAIPVGTTYGTDYANPYADISDDYGDKCFVTGNSNTTDADNDDVDNGNVNLFSPVFDLTGYTDPYVRYYRWFYDGAISGNTPDDGMSIKLNNGSQQVTIETISASVNEWTQRQFRVSDFIPATSNMRLIVEVNDLTAGNPNIVEGAIDRFEVLEGAALIAATFEDIKFSVFPNPTTGVVNVRYETTGNTLQLSVTNLLGEELLVKDLQGNMQGQASVNLSGYANGLYLLSMQNGSSKKVLKFSLLH